MKFIYIDAEGNSCGPVDEVQIERGIAAGTITAQTAIRNAMLKDFRTVDSFDCFAEALEKAAGAAAETPEATGGFFTRLAQVSRPVQTTAFVARFTPRDAGAGRRLCAALFDAILLGAVGAALLFWTSSAVLGRARVIPLEPAPETQTVRGTAPAAPAERQTANAAPARPTAPGSVRSGSNDTAGGRLARRISGNLRRVEELNDARNAAVAAEVGDRKASAPAADAPRPAAPEAAPETAAGKVLERILPPGQPLFTLWKSEVSADGMLSIQPNDRERLELPAAEFREAFRRPAMLWVLIVFLYYSLTLGFLAQTFGMWFWGIFLTRKEVGEVYGLRAMAYTVALLLFGILMIPSVLLFRRSPADLLCGVRQIGVASASGN